MNDPSQRYQDSALDAGRLLASVARTNVQLYNQVSDQNRPQPELALIRRAYDLSALLYSGAYQADGKPFVTHVVSVASTMALLGQPSALVAAALLHNVYNNADFGDGRRGNVSEKRRDRVREAVGGEVESLICSFSELRIERHLDELLPCINELDARKRALLVMDLADLLEKHLDQGVLYFGQYRWVTEFSLQRTDDLVRLAGALGQPVLGEALRRAIETVRNGAVPEVLRSSEDRKYLHYLPPLSYRRKWPIVLQQVRYTPVYRWLKEIMRRLDLRGSHQSQR
jgi:hypothetical protein